MNGCLSKYDQQVCSKRTPCNHRSNLKKTTVFFSQKHNFEYIFWLWTQNVQNFFKFFRQGCENRTPCFQKNILKKKLLCKKLHFYIFSWFCWEFLTWRKTPWSSRRHSTWPVESFGEEFLGETKNSWVLWKERNFQFFGETVLAELSKLHFVCPEKHFEKNELFLEKNMTLNPFSDFGWKTSFSGLKLRQGCQNWNLRAQRPFWRNVRKKINSIFFSGIYGEYFELHKNLGFASKAFFVSSGTFRGNIF